MICQLFALAVLVHARDPLVSVITLDSQADMYSDFERVWRSVWPTLQPRKFDAIKRSRRGEGCCLSIMTALADDEKSSSASSLLFEVDALPFQGVDYQSLSLASHDDFDVYFLFGHNVGCARRCSLVLQQPWTEINFQWGTVSLLVPGARRLRVIEELRAYCLSERPFYAVDEFLSGCGLRVAIATPLLVDHPKFYWSTTHQKNDTYPHAGIRSWWVVSSRLPKSTGECRSH